MAYSQVTVYLSFQMGSLGDIVARKKGCSFSSDKSLFRVYENIAGQLGSKPLWPKSFEDAAGDDSVQFHFSSMAAGDWKPCLPRSQLWELERLAGPGKKVQLRLRLYQASEVDTANMADSDYYFTSQNRNDRILRVKGTFIDVEDKESAKALSPRANSDPGTPSGRWDSEACPKTGEQESVRNLEAYLRRRLLPSALEGTSKGEEDARPAEPVDWQATVEPTDADYGDLHTQSAPPSAAPQHPVPAAENLQTELAPQWMDNAAPFFDNPPFQQQQQQRRQFPQQPQYSQQKYGQRRDKPMQQHHHQQFQQAPQAYQQLRNHGQHQYAQMHQPQHQQRQQFQQHAEHQGHVQFHHLQPHQRQSYQHHDHLALQQHHQPHHEQVQQYGQHGHPHQPQLPPAHLLRHPAQSSQSYPTPRQPQHPRQRLQPQQQQQQQQPQQQPQQPQQPAPRPEHGPDDGNANQDDLLDDNLGDEGLDQLARALFHAVIKASGPDVLQSLLQAGADVRQTDMKGNAVMHFWARATVGRDHLLPIGIDLLRAGADVNVQRHTDGMSPLHHVCIRQNNRRGWLNYHKALFLLRNGSDPNLRTHSGQLPGDLLRRQDDKRESTQRLITLLTLAESSSRCLPFDWPSCETPHCAWCSWLCSANGSMLPLQQAGQS